ncbi:MAG: DNA cytosine methyltransferase, partial [Candidatus Shapirobacteria bacterium]
MIIKLLFFGESLLSIKQNVSPTFIDLFSGCGGLSLGLIKSGWKGVFAVEHDHFAFKTFKFNFLDGDLRNSFIWPTWLPKRPNSIENILKKYKQQISTISTSIDMIVGGPPCQGFSTAGRRDPKDPRNRLFKAYLKVVSIINPKIVLLENVTGIALDFTDSELSSSPMNYAKLIISKLSITYNVFSKAIDVS